MKILAICVTLLIALTGCASFEKVDIPVVRPCAKLTLPPMPYLPIYDLTEKSTPDIIIKSYVASVDTLKNHARLIQKQNS